MSEIQIKVKKLDPRASLPSRSSLTAAGADLRVVLDKPVTINPGETYFCHTGIAAEIPDGYAGFVFARSGLGTKQGLAPANKVGVVDSDYRGEFMVALHNHSSEPRIIEHGDRVAQLVIMPVAMASYVECEELSDTDRGAGGFGSTGVK
ncbi:MAG: dUTP diphosphatase [Oscillospiraceae bacterium]|nr:dUTP diphosphatase [Oscillospiraceae bacterium]